MSSLSSATSSFISMAFDFIKIIFTFSTLRSPLHILFFCPHLIILRLHVLPDRWPSLQHFISSDDLQRGRMFFKYYLRIFKVKIEILFQCDVETATGVYSCLSLDMQVMQSLFRTYFRNRFYNIS